MKIVKNSLFLLFFFLFVQSVSAQSSMDTNKDIDPFFKNVIDDFSEVEGKIVSLAEAIPQDKYNWSPEEGVRSVSEVLKHVAGANISLFQFLGDKKHEGMGEDMGKDVTEKDQIIKSLKDSYAYAKDFISKMNMDDLEKDVNFYGTKTNYRGMLFIIMTHGHEHLGQLIAYARMNHITPPWSK